MMYCILIVVLIDTGKPSLQDSCIIIIPVEDINDNRPFFPFSEYPVTVVDTEDVDSRIYIIKATDRDIGNNSKIVYELTSNPGGFFRLDNNTGFVYVNRSLTEYVSFTRHIW
jgi:hypothetical protein